jgi:sulfonate transport system substrate-binding protein
MRNFQSSTIRTLFTAALALAAFLSCAVAQNALPSDRVIRIGYQKYGTLVLLKARGSLEKRLAAMHIDVQWTEFPAGPQFRNRRRGSADFCPGRRRRSYLRWQ